MLLTTPSLQNTTDAQKIDYVKQLREFRSSFSGYEAAYMEKIGQLALAELDLMKAIDEHGSQKDIKDLESQKALRVYQLEELGITTQDRYDANPEYWKEKILDAKIRIEQGNTLNVSYSDKSSSIHQAGIWTQKGHRCDQERQPKMDEGGYM